MSGEEPIQLDAATLDRIKFLQSKISDLQWKADRADDPDIKEGFALEIYKLGMKVAQLQKGLSEELKSEAAPSAVDDDELEPLPVPTSVQLMEADSLIQRARLEKVRGNLQGSTDLLKKAATIAPGAAPVLEALGDDYADRKMYQAAHEAYGKARRADPTSASIERKYAALAMYGKGGLSLDEQIAMNLTDSNLLMPGEAYASPKIAMILSYFVPGLGEFVLGYPKKGAAIFIITLCSITLFVLLKHFLNPKGSPPAIAYFFLIVGILTYVAGIIDTQSIAKPIGRKEIDRPVPPVNKPFE